jgi:heme A synthase
VDTLLRAGTDRSALMDLLPDGWKWHRSGAWVVLAAHLFWMASWWRATDAGSAGRRAVAWAAALLAGQTFTGLAFVFLDMPAWSQPLHLLWAMGLLSWDGWLLMRWRRR